MIVSLCRRRTKKSFPFMLRTFGLSEEVLKHYQHKRWVGGADLYFNTEQEKEEAYKRLKEFVYADSPKEMEEVVVDMLKKTGLKLATAESCSGGLLSARIVNVPGSSKVFLGGFVVYANELKTKLLSVEESLLKEFGAVSAEVCRAMCVGALEETDADVCIAITGIAGPDGGIEEKPVGLTFIGIGTDSEVMVERYQLKGQRNQNRFFSTQIALDTLRRFLLKRYMND